MQRFSISAVGCPYPLGQLLVSSIKGVKKKTPLLWPDFFLASSPPRLSRIVLAFRSGSRGAGSFSQRFWFSLPAVFIAFAQRSRSVRRPTSSSGCQVPTMVLLGTRGPQLFRVVRGGLGSREKLSVPEARRA